MTLASTMESSGAILTLVTPLIAVPLTAITFYVRSLREQHESAMSGVVRQIEAVDGAITEMRRMLLEFERDYTTKAEWLRECMLARRTLDQLSETAVRLETLLERPSRTRATNDCEDHT